MRGEFSVLVRKDGFSSIMSQLEVSFRRPLRVDLRRSCVTGRWPAAFGQVQPSTDVGLRFHADARTETSPPRPNLRAPIMSIASSSIHVP